MGVDLRAKWERLQAPVVGRWGADLDVPGLDLMCGVSRNVINAEYTRTGDYPLNGLRHPAEGDTCGWYLWAGEYSDASDFFVPVHTAHLETYCPDAVPFLGLPAGWRFLLAPGHEDVWFDDKLLQV